MIGAAILKARRLPSAGRAFGAAIQSLGPGEAASLKRFANAWRAILQGKDSPAVRKTLAAEGDRLRKAIERLPDATPAEAATRYEAAMALHMRVPGRSAGERFPARAKSPQTATQLAKDAADELKRLAALAQNTSVHLEPSLEKLVGGFARELGNDIGDLLRRAAAGKSLGLREQEALTQLQALKSITGARFDDFVEELSRECVRQLKPSATAPLKNTRSKLNAIQGAVAQGAFFRSRQFSTVLSRRLLETRRQVRKHLGRMWTTTAITEGRVFIVKKSETGGLKLVEYVDGALAVHEGGLTKGRLAKGFLDFSGQVKAEVRVTALAQNLEDELRRTPNWGSYDAILMIPNGKGYKAIQLVAPPIEMPPQRLLIAAEGGIWPADTLTRPTVYGTTVADGPLSRDGCRAIGRYVLSRARATLK